MTLRVGIVGAGLWAQRAHLPGFLRAPDVEIRAIADPDLGRAQALAAPVRRPPRRRRSPGGSRRGCGRDRDRGPGRRAPCRGVGGARGRPARALRETARPQRRGGLRPRAPRGARWRGDEARLRVPVQPRAPSASGARPGRVRGTAPHPDRLQPEPSVPGPARRRSTGRWSVRGPAGACSWSTAPTASTSRDGSSGRSPRCARTCGRWWPSGPIPGAARRAPSTWTTCAHGSPVSRAARRRFSMRAGPPWASRGGTSRCSATPAPSCGGAATMRGRSPTCSAPRPRRPAFSGWTCRPGSPRASSGRPRWRECFMGSLVRRFVAEVRGAPAEGPTFLDGYRAQVALHALATSLAERRWVTLPT